MKKKRVSDLTIEELESLIRQTVQQSVAEVLIEFAIASEADERILYEAEMADYLRSSLRGKLSINEPIPPWDLDD